MSLIDGEQFNVEDEGGAAMADMSKSTSSKKGEVHGGLLPHLIMASSWLLLNEDFLAVNDIKALKVS